MICSICAGRMIFSFFINQYRTGSMLASFVELKVTTSVCARLLGSGVYAVFASMPAILALNFEAVAHATPINLTFDGTAWPLFANPCLIELIRASA